MCVSVCLCLCACVCVYVCVCVCFSVCVYVLQNVHTSSEDCVCVLTRGHIAQAVELKGVAMETLRAVYFDFSK